MIVVPCKQTTYFDVDDTLIMWSATQQELDARGVEITSPESVVFFDGEDEPRSVGKFTQKVLPHRVHIEQMIKHKLRGHTIVVWSAGGWDWAEAAVRALGLEKYVDLVISKPTWTYDDKQPDDFIPKPYWMKDES